EAGGKIYAIGGVNSVFLNVVEEYDPAANAWATKAPMPNPRYDLAAAAVGGKIYAIGGNHDNGVNLSVVEEYDPAANTWTTKAPMPTVRKALAAAEVGGKIYAIGGYGSGGLSDVDEYDAPSANHSTTKAQT